jgi:chaperonin GroEL
LSLESLKAEGDEQRGINIVRQACEEPLRQIYANAGGNETEVIGTILERKEIDYGFNAITRGYENLLATAPLKMLQHWPRTY